MKTKSFFYKLALTLCFLTFTQTAYSLQPSYDIAFTLNPVNDGIQLGLGSALSGSALICDKIVHLKKNNFDPSALDKTSISDIDLLFANPYSKPLHIAGTATVALSLLTPAAFAVLPQSEWLTIGVMYTESLLFANGIKEWIKLLVYRARPYMYFDGYPQDKVDEGDWNCSFPSGHTTFAFTAASFTTMLFCNYFPDSKWKYAVAGASFGLAAITGILRMASGNHFFSDVIAGAFIGTVCGIAVPYMHSNYFYSKYDKKNKSVNTSFSPAGFNVHFSF